MKIYEIVYLNGYSEIIFANSIIQVMDKYQNLKAVNLVVVK